MTSSDRRLVRTATLTVAATLALVTLTACGGGGSGPNTAMNGGEAGGGQTGGQPTPTQLAAASSIALNESFAGTIASATESDYFRLPVQAEGILMIATTGNANPQIRAYDAAGIEIPGTVGSYVVTITQAILAKGRHIFIEFYGGTAGETYSGSTELTPSPSLSLADKLRLYRGGNPPLYMTPAQVKEAALGTLFAMTHIVGPANDFIDEGGGHTPNNRQPHETTTPIPWSDVPSGVVNGYNASRYGRVMSHNGVNVFTATRRLMYESAIATGPSPCTPGMVCTPSQPVQITELEDYSALGGWMDHSYFEASSIQTCDTANVGCSGSSPVYGSGHGLTYDAFVRPSGTNPTGTGSATWNGVMTGVSWASNSGGGEVIRYIGDARIAIENLAAPVVDVSFTNIHDLATASRHPGLLWNDLAVIDGKFGEHHSERVDLGNGGFQYEVTEIGATFAGPNHEEVVGTFSRDYIVSGAFGAMRQ